MKAIVLQSLPGWDPADISLNQAVTLRLGAPSTIAKYVAGGVIKAIVPSGTLRFVSVAFPDTANLSGAMLDLQCALRVNTSATAYKWVFGGLIKSSATVSNK